MLNKREIIAYTKRLDKIADDVEKDWRRYGLTKAASHDFCLKVDQLSDRIEGLVGIDKKAEVLETSDGPLMDTFNQHGVLETHDEDVAKGTDAYMDHFDEDPKGQFHTDPLKGESREELVRKKADYWGEEKTSSMDYWNDEKTASSDYWNDEKTASTDYWNDEKTASSDYWNDEKTSSTDYWK